MYPIYKILNSKINYLFGNPLKWQKSVKLFNVYSTMYIVMITKLHVNLFSRLLYSHPRLDFILSTKIMIFALDIPTRHPPYLPIMYYFRKMAAALGPFTYPQSIFLKKHFYNFQMYNSREFKCVQ